MYTKQNNAYKNFSESNNTEQVIIVYEELIRLIKESQTDSSKKNFNLEQALDILIKLFAATEDTTQTKAKQDLQAFYLVTIKNIAKILYCNQRDLYIKLLQDLEVVKSVFEEMNNT